LTRHETDPLTQITIPTSFFKHDLMPYKTLKKQDEEEEEEEEKKAGKKREQFTRQTVY
jgi:hypothetical protein